MTDRSELRDVVLTNEELRDFLTNDGIFSGPSRTEALAELDSLEEQLQSARRDIETLREAHENLSPVERQSAELRIDRDTWKQAAQFHAEKAKGLLEQLKAARQERDELKRAYWASGPPGPDWKRAKNAEHELDELKEQLEAADVVLDWIAQNHRRVIVEMPTDIFQALRRASVSSPASTTRNNQYL